MLSLNPDNLLTTPDVLSSFCLKIYERYGKRA